MNPESHVASRTGRLSRITSVYGIPDGAVVLDRASVVRVQWSLIHHWKPKSEMWPLLHGPSILAAFGAVGGVICNLYFRRAFGVQNIGQLGSFIPTTLIPAALAPMTHQLWVTNPLLVGDFPCSLCAEIRSGTIHALASAVYPSLMALPMSIAIARKHWTYPVPRMSQPKEVLNMLRVTGRPFQMTFLGLLLGQFTMGMVLAHKEQRVFNENLSQGMIPGDAGDADVES